MFASSLWSDHFMRTGHFLPILGAPLLLCAAGCQIPEYHRPKGFSSTYHRHLFAEPHRHLFAVPAPADSVPEQQEGAGREAEAATGVFSPVAERPDAAGSPQIGPR
jgi:hypothetical protein